MYYICTVIKRQLVMAIRTTIKDFTEDYEIVGHYRNFGFDVTITVSDVKAYFPKSEWGVTMSSAVEVIKELSEI